MRILSVRPSVHPPICPSVKRVDCDKTKEKCVQILHHTKDHLASFSEKRMVCRGDPFNLKFWVNGPRWSEIADFKQIIAQP